MSSTNPADPAPAAAYLDRFVAAFGTFDGNQVAALFAAQAVVLGRDGLLVGLPTRGDVVRYYQAALDRYRREGSQSCRWSDLSTASMGSRALLATATWKLLPDDGVVLTRWRQSYSLGLFGEGGWKAFAAATHAGQG